MRLFTLLILSMIVPWCAFAGPCKKSTDAFTGQSVSETKFDLLQSAWEPEPLMKLHLKRNGEEVSGRIVLYRKGLLDFTLVSGTLIRMKLEDGQVVELASQSDVPLQLTGDPFTMWDVPVIFTEEQVEALASQRVVAIQVHLPEEMTQEITPPDGNKIKKAFSCVAL